MPKLAENRQAAFNYEILDNFEAGISLFGFEVKAALRGMVSLKGAYISIRNGEAFLLKARISPYQPANTPAWYEPERDRKLLLSKEELQYLIGKTSEKGLTLIPLSVYTKKRLIKLEFALARSKKKFEKREKIKEREFKITKERIMKEQS